MTKRHEDKEGVDAEKEWCLDVARLFWVFGNDMLMLRGGRIRLNAHVSWWWREGEQNEAVGVARMAYSGSSRWGLQDEARKPVCICKG